MEFFALLMQIRYRPRSFDRVGHENTYASNENKHFFTVRPTKIMNKADKKVF